MRYFKYLALLAVLIVLAAVHSQAQVAIGVQIGPTYGYYNVPPPCPYGYYSYYPFDCAPYGYWGPQWFADGVFIGTGPWYRFYYLHPVLYRRWYGPGYVYFPREHAFHRFRERDWDDDDDDDRRFRRDRDFRRFDRDDRWFRDHDRGFHGRKHHHGHGRGHDEDD